MASTVLRPHSLTQDKPSGSGTNRRRINKLFCVYIDDEAAVREHATNGGFPCNAINKVGTIIDPTTAEVA